MLRAIINLFLVLKLPLLLDDGRFSLLAASAEHSMYFSLANWIYWLMLTEIEGYESVVTKSFMLLRLPLFLSFSDVFASAVLRQGNLKEYM